MRPVLDDSLRLALRKAGPLELLSELVRAPSHAGLERQEEQTAGILAGYLRSHGIEAQLTEVRPGRPNLVARLGRPKQDRSLLLLGHTDTVAPNDHVHADPFAARVRDGRLFGRGACDMKGALAAMAAAVVALSRSNRAPAGEVALAAVIDEEKESLGAEDLIRSGLRASGCVVGEPTENRVAIGHRGLEWLEAEFSGRATHAGSPRAGVNAIVAAARFVQLLEEELQPILQNRSHLLLGSPSLSVGVVSGGDHPSTVPARCTVQLDRRWVPGETVEQIFAEVEALLTRVRSANPGVTTVLRRVRGGMATMIHGPLETKPDHPLVEAALNARAEVSGDTTPPESFPAWTDGALLAREAGIPCIVMGPGNISQAHSAEEWVAVEQIHQAALQYAAVALHFLGTS